MDSNRSGISAGVTGLQAAADAEFARALQPRSLSFPQDHGPHPEYQTEWWYYTGNLKGAEGRHLGYQLTVFRRALTPAPIERLSAWGTTTRSILPTSRSPMSAPIPISRRNDSRAARPAWRAPPAHPTMCGSRIGDIGALDAHRDRVRLKAYDSGHGIDLTLTSIKPAVLHGENGLSPKSGEPGNASYYYSLTRLATEGTIQVNGETLSATGFSWMDHEFGTTLLGPNATGWDWFSIQLSDDREIMFFQIRQKDGSIEPVSGGTLVEKDGTARRLALAAVQVKTAGTWTANSGATYPARWEIVIPSAGINSPCGLSSPTRKCASLSCTGKGPSKSTGNPTERRLPVPDMSN